jgi:hypothetical protein
MFGPRPAAAVSLLSTRLFGGGIAYLGIWFAANVEPDEFGWGAVVFFLGVGFVCTAGLWLVPLGLRSVAHGAGIIKVIALACQVPLLLLFISLVVNQLQRLSRFGEMSSAPSLLFGCAGVAAVSYLATALLRARLHD